MEGHPVMENQEIENLFVAVKPRTVAESEPQEQRFGLGRNVNIHELLACVCSKVEVAVCEKLWSGYARWNSNEMTAQALFELVHAVTPKHVLLQEVSQLRSQKLKLFEIAKHSRASRSSAPSKSSSAVKSASPPSAQILARRRSPRTKHFRARSSSESKPRDREPAPSSQNKRSASLRAPRRNESSLAQEFTPPFPQGITSREQVSRIEKVLDQLRSSFVYAVDTTTTASELTEPPEFQQF